MAWWQVTLIILLAILVGLGAGYFIGFLVITRIMKKPFFEGMDPASLFSRLGGSPVTEEARREAEAARLVKQNETRARKEAEAAAREQTRREAEAARLARQKEASAKEEAEATAREQARRQAEVAAREQAQREVEAARMAAESEPAIREEAGVGEASKEPVAEAVMSSAPAPEAGKTLGEALSPELYDEIESNSKLAAEPWTGKLTAFKADIWDRSPDEVQKLPVELRDDLTQAYVDMRLANSIVWLSTELGRRSDHLDENYQKLCTNIASRLATVVPLLKKPD